VPFISTKGSYSSMNVCYYRFGKTKKMYATAFNGHTFLNIIIAGSLHTVLGQELDAHDL
jgi:hypothetical protein